MNVKEFIEQAKSKTSHKGKLTPWKAEISELREAGMTYKQIQEFLSIHKVNVSLKSITVFCKKHFTNTKIEKSQTQPRQAGLESTSKHQQANPQAATERKKSNYVPPPWAGDADIDDII
ncbi:hypothetical protein V757_12550 [Pelistega indica]|uniref:Uncharacterized protein n=1 Tax=Pelistega indica TaxID=1414851 RepID=V8FT18_9BURK|nr:MULTISPECIES: hypothetical protein [Pelistega]ETD66547.1 hypothetical protein V757_12550 [Pelistega indica]